MSATILLFASTISATLLALLVLYPLSIRFGLVDVPQGRKQHTGAVPLIGGIAVYLGLLFSLTAFASSELDIGFYLACSGGIVLLGVFDDFLSLSVKLRLAVQLLLGLAMIYCLDLHIFTLGNLLGLGQIQLGIFGIPFTLIAVIAAINAFNMTDGIDGLAGMLALISFSGMALFMTLWGQQHYAIFAFAIAIALLPYLAFNLTLFNRKKVFLGDAGSMLIGFSVIWLLVLGTQSPSASFRPVTALWLIAIPLMDMLAISLRRIAKGQSPFKADREHLHHISLRMGLNSKESLLFISALAGIFVAIGIIGERLLLPESVMFILFLVVLSLYMLVLQHIWRIMSFFRQRRITKSI